MAGSFRRAHLRGSEELFRPTRPDGDDAPGHASRGDAVAAAPPPAPVPLRPEGRLVRLTDEEIDILAEAVQRMRYPTQSKAAQKPSIDVFERLGELRSRLLESS